MARKALAHKARAFFMEAPRLFAFAKEKSTGRKTRRYTAGR